MLVERMIKELKKMNPKAEIKMHHRLGESALFIVTLNNDDNEVWIESESDNDMHSEIEARFEHAAETQMDELDFYMDMLEIGIDVNMVREYMGEERAEHMEQFCKGHGLI